MRDRAVGQGHRVEDQTGRPCATPGGGDGGADPLPPGGVGAESIESLDRIINCIPDPIFVKDHRHRLVLVNDAECALAGKSRHELLGRADDSIIPEEQLDVFWRQDDRVIETGEESVSEEELPDAQGRVRTIITRKTRFVDSTGNRFVVGVIRDITERKRAEERLVSLAAAVEQSADDIVVTDVDGRIRYANSAFERTTGFSLTEAVGKDAAALLGGDRNDAVHLEMWEALRAGRPWQGRFHNRARDGRPLLQDASISAIRDTSGQIVGYVSARRDVTRQVELEERLAQTEKLEAIGALAGGVAHDFNNLLTVILSHLTKVIDGLDASGPLRRSAEKARAAAERCASLTRQLLALGRKQVVHPETLDVNACVRRMADLLGSAIRKDISLVTALSPGLGPVHADPRQIEQVVLNLVLNARDAMPRGGVLRVGTANAEVGAEGNGHGPVHPGRYVVLEVSDTGTGIDPGIRDRIFEPFFTTKEQGQGTGLGLATVYAIVKQSGGEIGLDSEPGVGTTFRIHLPRVAAEVARETGGDASPGAAGRPARILLVEDEEAVRELAREILETGGYAVLEAGNGVEALRVCEDCGETIDLLLTDVVMPLMKGPDLVEKLRPRRPRTRVMYMSGYTGQALDSFDLASSATAFLQKPFTPQALLRQVEQVLAGPLPALPQPEPDAAAA